MTTLHRPLQVRFSRKFFGGESESPLLSIETRLRGLRRQKRRDVDE